MSKYGGGKQGWGQGTPSHKSQRRSDRHINRARQSGNAYKAGNKNGNFWGCAVIAFGALGAGVTGAVVLGVMALKGWA